MTNQSSFGRRGASTANNRRIVHTEITQPIEVVITRRGTSKWKIALYVIGGFLVMGVVGNLVDPDKATAKTETVGQTATTKPTAPKKCGATLKEFTSLRTGMSLGQVTSIIGCTGEELSRIALGGTETVMFSWPGEAGFISNMNATFDNDHLMAKAQLGLE